VTSCGCAECVCRIRIGAKWMSRLHDFTVFGSVGDRDTQEIAGPDQLRLRRVRVQNSNRRQVDVPTSRHHSIRISAKWVPRIRPGKVGVQNQLGCPEQPTVQNQLGVQNQLTGKVGVQNQLESPGRELPAAPLGRSSSVGKVLGVLQENSDALVSVVAGEF
jgi:hypothetical protein